MIFQVGDIVETRYMGVPEPQYFIILKCYNVFYHKIVNLDSAQLTVCNSNNLILVTSIFREVFEVKK